MILRLNEHGDFKLKVIDTTIILLDAEGPWNKPTLDRYDREVKKIVETFDGRPWYHVAHLLNENLLIPEVESDLTEHFKWRKTVNIVSDTIVFSEKNIAQSVSKQQLDIIYAELGMVLNYANSVQQAISKIKESYE